MGPSYVHARTQKALHETAKGPAGDPPASSPAYEGVNDQEAIRNIGCRSEDHREGCRSPSFSAGRSNDPEANEFFRPNNPEAGRTVAQDGSSHLVLPEHS